MKYIKTYEKHRSINEKFYNENVLLLHDVKLTGSDEDLFRNIFEKFLSIYKMDLETRDEINNYISSEYLTEGFFDKLKKRFPKAAEVSKVLSDKAESALGNILKSVKDAVSFVKKIGQGIKEFFLKVVESGKKMFTEQIKNGKLKDKIGELTKSKKEGFISDLKTSKEIINFYRKTFMGKLLGSTEKNLTDFMSKEQEPIAESINEGKNVIATLVHGIESIPPFSWLHKVAQAGEAGAASVIKAISTLTNKLGGPTFELPVIALLVGIVIEQMVKGTAGHWLIDLAGSATPLGMAIKGVKTIAFFVALIVALDGIIGETLLGGHHDEKEEKKEISRAGDPKTPEPTTPDISEPTTEE